MVQAPIQLAPVQPNSQSLDIAKFKQQSNDPLTGAGGRALLHDLDTKFNEQDRVMKFLMS
jgi:hypothetical protein